MIRSKKRVLTNFSGSAQSESFCLRPDNEHELLEFISNNHPTIMLARGSGLSYSDSCLNKDSLIIDTQRLNHLIEFNPETGIAVCQSGVLIKDLYLLHDEFIPPVIPGTVYATIAGGIAHDVHGKNNPHAGSFGQHIVWFDLLIGKKTFHCSREQYSDLFYATLGGAGLTGIITQAAIRLKKASRFVQVEKQRYTELPSLLEKMSTTGLNYDYQVAWIDLLNATPRAILSLANHCAPLPNTQEKKQHSIPKIPFCLIHQWNMKWFYAAYFKHQRAMESQPLEQFNNPLDKVKYWSRLYGSKGLIQFQALFNQNDAEKTLEQFVQLIRQHKATPTLAVLKLLIRSGEGLLSFCNPGFTLAIDFPNNANARAAIKAMNQFTADIHGRIYLAKDLLLSAEQYQKMYAYHEQFSQVLTHYHCPIQSDLSKRLGITR